MSSGSCGLGDLYGREDLTLILFAKDEKAPTLGGTSTSLLQYLGGLCKQCGVQENKTNVICRRRGRILLAQAFLGARYTAMTGFDVVSVYIEYFCDPRVVHLLPIRCRQPSTTSCPHLDLRLGIHWVKTCFILTYLPSSSIGDSRDKERAYSRLAAIYTTLLF
jgi:hypothetical protein